MSRARLGKETLTSALSAYDVGLSSRLQLRQNFALHDTTAALLTCRSALDGSFHYICSLRYAASWLELSTYGPAHRAFTYLSLHRQIRRTILNIPPDLRWQLT